MTYASYLLLFLGVPLTILVGATARERLVQPRLARWTLLAHVLVAVVYTTPWDNYLVATGVWWYDPQRVLGVVFGWVPVEEYTFFVLQTLVTGLWLLWLMRRFGEHAQARRWHWQVWRPGLLAAAALGLLWLAALAALWARWQPATYLALELAWFLPPIMLQIVVGARVLWCRRRLVLAALLPPLLYLTGSDALAMAQGIWTINPARTLGITLGGVLPLEEIIFFTLTNMLIVFGVLLTITLAPRLLATGRSATETTP